jgi:hemolysin III
MEVSAEPTDPTLSERPELQTVFESDTPAPRHGDYPLGEEIANSIAHGSGVLLAIVALILLTVAGSRAGGAAPLAGGIVFGMALVLEYAASTLYHALPQPKAKHVFKILDHAGIYVLIAGSYTPFTLLGLKGTLGWGVFAFVWTMAVVGITVEAFWVYRPRWVSVVIYLAMGWAVVFTIGTLIRALAPAEFWLLVAGGLAYTLGTPFYVLKRIPYFHFVWHLMVVVGSACHVVGALFLIARS